MIDLHFLGKDSCEQSNNCVAQQTSSNDVSVIKLQVRPASTMSSSSDDDGGDVETRLSGRARLVDTHQKTAPVRRCTPNNATSNKYLRNKLLDRNNTLTPHVRLMGRRPVMAGAPYLWNIMETVTSMPLGGAARLRLETFIANVKVPNTDKVNISH